MADNSFSFRTALQGFNRTDVVNFIEASTVAHENELRQLQVANSHLMQQLDQANAYISQLQATISAAQTAPVQLVPDTAEDLPPLAESVPVTAPVASTDFEEMELAAYRRAEQAERSAKERVAKLFEQVDTLVGETNQKLKSDSQSLSDVIGQLGTNIASLQQTMLRIRTTMDGSTAFMKDLDLPLANTDADE